MDYITAIARELVLYQGFSPVKDNSGNIAASNNSVLLFNNEWGRNSLTELIYAGSLDFWSFQGRFENGRSFMKNHLEIQELFNIYIFPKTPDNTTMEYFYNFQETDYRALKFIRSIIVDLEKKEVLTFTKDPVSQKKIKKLLEKPLLQRTFSSYEQKDTACIGTIIESLLASDEYAQVKKQAQLTFNKNAPAITWMILSLNIIVFILMELSGGSAFKEILIRFGAKYNPAIQNGEYWRLVTPMFLHIGYLHMLVNSFSLYNLRILESIYGSPRFLFIYITAGIAGNVCSFLFSPSISAGASGAIFGLMGSLLYIHQVKPRAFARIFGSSVITVIAANLIFGLTNAGIDNFAHLGGLIGGYLTALLVGLPNKKD